MNLNDERIAYLCSMSRILFFFEILNLIVIFWLIMAK